VHEARLIADLVRKIEALAREHGANRVTKVRVRLGALSHMTPEHFRDHFALVTQGTVAEGAETEIEVNHDTTAPDAHSVRLLEITVRKP